MTNSTIRRLLATAALLPIPVLFAVANDTATAAPTVPGGGFMACTGGFSNCGTIGLPWADGSNNPVGHLTVAHLAESEGQVVRSVAFNGVPETQMTVTKATHSADIGLVSLVSPDVAPTITLSDKTVLSVTGYAKEGDIKTGQAVCHSGWNSQTSKVHEICGTVSEVGPTDNCRAVGTGSSSCAVLFTASGSVGGPGDSGAAAYTYKADGTVTVIGLFKGITGSRGIIEPTYAATQLFGGKPLTGTATNPPTTTTTPQPTTPRPSTGSAG